MVSSLDRISDSWQSSNEHKTVTLVANGAEIEFLPLTDFPMMRLSPQIIDKLKSINQLYKYDSKMMSRQPAFYRLMQMLVTVALINYHGDRQYPGDCRYTAKLNRQDFEKHKSALLKQVQRYDTKTSIEWEDPEKKAASVSTSTANWYQGLFSPQKYIQKLIDLIKLPKRDFVNIENRIHANIEPLITSICDRIEALNLVTHPGDRVLSVGVDGSVHGTNPANIQAYERLYRTKQDTRFNFRIYSGQEIGFPVCESIQETNQIYDFVVETLKKNGVNFTTTAGVHLHVNIVKADMQVEEAIAQIANTTIATAAVSQILDAILPTTRRQNVYAATFGDDVDEHITRHQRQLSKLEYIQTKVKMMQRAILSDPNLLLDKNAAIYEFILAITYGIAPIQHEYNYQKILAISSKSAPEIARQASIIVRNPRYTSINITPFLHDPSKPTYEWRVLASCADSQLQSKFMTFLYRVIDHQYQVQTTEVITDHIHNLDYLYFYYHDGRVRTMPNTLKDWLEFTECLEMFTTADFDKINNPDYWQGYDLKNQEYLDIDVNHYWATGQFYPAPIIAQNDYPDLAELMNKNLETREYLEQDAAIVNFLNHVLDVEIE